MKCIHIIACNCTTEYLQPASILPSLINTAFQSQPFNIILSVQLISDCGQSRTHRAQTQPWGAAELMAALYWRRARLEDDSISTDIGLALVRSDRTILILASCVDCELWCWWKSWRNSYIRHLSILCNFYIMYCYTVPVSY